MEWRNSSSEYTPEEDSCTSQSLAAKHSKMYQSNTSVEVLCCYANLVILISKNYRMHYTGSRTHLHTRYTGSSKVQLGARRNLGADPLPSA
jgi:hypothetical protein